jgi:hypothetical protein
VRVSKPVLLEALAEIADEGQRRQEGVEARRVVAVGPWEGADERVRDPLAVHVVHELTEARAIRAGCVAGEERRRRDPPRMEESALRGRARLLRRNAGAEPEAASLIGEGRRERAEGEAEAVRVDEVRVDRDGEREGALDRRRSPMSSEVANVPTRVRSVSRAGQPSGASRPVAPVTTPANVAACASAPPRRSASRLPDCARSRVSARSAIAAASSSAGGAPSTSSVHVAAPKRRTASSSRTARSRRAAATACPRAESASTQAFPSDALRASTSPFHA